MKKLTNYKQLIIGLIIGAATTLSISALAEYVIEPNPYPVTLNGAPINIEGYNINGYTYFKLRDVGDKVGFGVDFQNDTICINRTGSTSNNTSTNNNNDKILQPIISVSEIPPKATTVNPKLGWIDLYIRTWDGEYSSDGLPIYTKNKSEYITDDRKYLDIFDIEKIYNVDLIMDIEIPQKYMSNYYVEYEYYETAIRPFIQNNN